jgi:hypothetical protein
MGRLLLWRFLLDVCNILGEVKQIANAIIALSTIPALLYTLIERGIFGWNTTVLGARYGIKWYE